VCLTNRVVHEEIRTCLVTPFVSVWLQGDRWRKIHSIDLCPMTPKIIPIKIEWMEFDDEIIDVLTTSVTLAYAEDFEKTIGAVARTPAR
jgi:hypothetical protein